MECSLISLPRPPEQTGIERLVKLTGLENQGRYEDNLLKRLLMNISISVIGITRRLNK